MIISFMSRACLDSVLLAPDRQRSAAPGHEVGGAHAVDDRLMRSKSKVGCMEYKVIYRLRHVTRKTRER